MNKAKRERDRKREFVAALADFLVSDQAKFSVGLAMNDPIAHRWQRLRAATPLMGYPTVEEAAKLLGEWLSIP